MQLEKFADAFTLTLNAAVATAPAAGTVETWTVVSTTGVLASSAIGVTQRYIVDAEIVLVTNTPSSTTLTVTRGAGGTIATHSNAATLTNIITAAPLNEWSTKAKATLYAAQDYGAKGDAVRAVGSITTGTATVTLTSGTFTSTAVDGGKAFTLEGAGASGAALETTISTVTDSTHAVLAANASTTVTSKVVSYGTNNSTALQNWLNDCGTYDKFGFLEAGSYKIVTALSHPAGVKITTAGRDLTSVDISSVANQTAGWEADGTVTGTTTTLTANVTEPSLTAAVTSAASFAAGDWVRMESTASTGTDGILAGELLKILSIASNTITFESYIQGNYTTAASGKITKVTLIEGVAISGVRFLGVFDNAVKQQIGFRAHLCLNPTVLDCGFTYCHFNGISNYESVGLRAERNDFYYCHHVTWGYAIAHDGAAQDAVVVHNTFTRCKAAVEHTGSTGTGGVARRCVFGYNTITSAYRGAMQAHTGAEDLTFIGNTVNSTIDDGTAGQCDGMNVFGTRMVIVGNVFTDMNRRAIYTGNGSFAPFRALIANNQIRRSTLAVSYGRGFEIVLNNSGGGAVESLIIDGNEVYIGTAQNANPGIELINTTTKQPGVTITNNELTSPTTWPALKGAFLQDFVISNNRIKNLGNDTTNSNGIQIDDSSDGVIEGNIITGPTGLTNQGISANNTTDVNCIGNRIRNEAVGIRTTGTSDRWVISSNNLTGCTTAKALVGSDNKISHNPGINPAGNGGITTPGMPATTVVVTNTTGFDVSVFIANGTAAMTAITIGGVATGMQIAASSWGMVRLPAGQTIALTYASGSPTWKWFAD